MDLGGGSSSSNGKWQLGKFKKKKKKKKMDLVQLTRKTPLPHPNVDYVFFLTIVLSFFSNL